MTVRHWDGATYDRISSPMQTWGLRVLERLELCGEEVALDAGCGSGRVTEALVKLLPRGRVIALDASPSMVQAARRRLGDSADVRLGDLLELDLEQEVDVVLSTATFHWIADHDRLYRRLRAALRPGGRLCAQCGGEGNVQRVHRAAQAAAEQEPFREYLRGWRGPWNFTSPEQARASLLTAGFRSARCWLEPAPVSPPEPREFLRCVILGAHLEQLPDPLGERFLSEVQERLQKPLMIDYVRLNIDAAA
jgi:trans-aconitate 2-methyltransferase